MKLFVSFLIILIVPEGSASATILASIAIL